MTRDYELGIILNPEVNEEETQAFLSRVEQVIAPYDGQVVRVQQWGRRRLAYPIERNRDGYYVFIDMVLTPETVSELERTLKVSETVLRHMFRRRDPKSVQQEREEREARAAQAAANAEAAAAQAAANAEAASSTEEVQQTPTTEETPATLETPATSETTEAPEVPDEDYGEVPPAVEEETVEA